MFKVLEFFGEPLEYGGQEAFMVNMYKNFQNENIKYTICTPFNLTNQPLIDIAKSRNEEILHYDYNNYSKFRRFYTRKALKDILSKEKFDAIHIQSSSLFTLFGCAKIAKKFGIKKIIVHSHIAAERSLKHSLYKLITDKFLKRYANIFCACSEKAAEYQYSKDIIDNKKYIVIKNGINVDKFRFSYDYRKLYREKFNINSNELLILNVGRFAKVKNHEFIVEILKSLNKINSNFKMIFVGDGELKEEIKNKIKENFLDDKTIFLEKRTDVAQIMMASDVFILPSLFEGFPVTLIEAQCTGLKSLCSNTITKEADITGLVKFIGIDNAEKWVNEIIINNQFNQREKYAEVVHNNGFDDKNSAKLLEEIYVG